LLAVLFEDGFRQGLAPAVQRVLSVSVRDFS
jgi:hypothetical protein